MKILELTFLFTPFKGLGFSSLGCLEVAPQSASLSSQPCSAAGLRLLHSAPPLFHSAGIFEYLFFCIQNKYTLKTIFLFLLSYIKCVLHIPFFCTLLFSANTLLNIICIHSKRSSLLCFWYGGVILHCLDVVQIF